MSLRANVVSEAISESEIASAPTVPRNDEDELVLRNDGYNKGK